MANTQVILLQRVENLGQMGEIVSVKPGYARNYLLPQQKALRANKSNVAYFETQKKQLEAANLTRKSEAEKVASKCANLSVIIIRQAAEGGQLYGSVSTRDIADAMKTAGITVDRNQITLNHAFKTIGLFPVTVFLHPEVKISVTVNVARSEEEAKVQAKTGKAVSDAKAQAEATAAEKAEFLDSDALAAETAADAAAQADAAAAAEKSAKRATKKAAKKADEPATDATTDDAAAAE